MPETMPGISFDQLGTCSYCQNNIQISYDRKAILLETILNNKNKASQYDAIVSISGGRDSTYTIIKLVKDFNMKVLAVNYRNPFCHPLAQKNINKIVTTLNVDLITFDFPNNIHQKSSTDFLKKWVRYPDPRFIGLLCIACKLIQWETIKIARKYKIPLIVSGRNVFEESSFKRVIQGISANEPCETAYIKFIKVLFDKGPAILSYIKPYILPMIVKGYLFGNPYALGSRIMGYNIKQLDLFFYLPWKEKEVLDRITEEVDWESPDASENWRFDCKMSHMKDLLFSITIGMTERDDFYSKLIRDGQLTREGALKRLKENQIDFASVYSLLQDMGIETIYSQLLELLKKKLS